MAARAGSPVTRPWPGAPTEARWVRVGARAGLPTERAGGAPSRALTLSFALRRPLPQTWTNSGECCGRAGGEGESGPGVRRGPVGAGWAQVTGRDAWMGAGQRLGLGAAAAGASSRAGPRSPHALAPLGPQDPGDASPPLSRQLSRPRWRSFRRWRREGMEPARLPRPRILEPFWGNPAAAARRAPKAFPRTPI